MISRGNEEMEGEIVVKFGGTSLANSERIKNVSEIIRSNDNIRYAVFSAPGIDKGKRDVKITDVLYNLYHTSIEDSNFLVRKIYSCMHPKDKSDYKRLGLSRKELSDILKDTFSGISTGLELDGRVEKEILSEIDMMQRDPLSFSEDYFASRGENYNTRLIADYMKIPFIDACDLIYAGDDPSGILGHNNTTMQWIQNKLGSLDSLVAIPGFYCNANPLGRPKKVKVFNRGGSDLTGSIIASGTNAVEYQNWSDQDGVLSVNPKLIDESMRSDIPVIKKMSYALASEAIYLDFSILCDDVFVPLISKDIPIIVRNTFNPSSSGTRIERYAEPDGHVSAIAMKSGYSGLVIEKFRINKQIGFGKNLMGILARHNISYDHCPSGIDNITVVVETEIIDEAREEILFDIKKKLKPDNVYVRDGLTLIAVLGEKINGNSDVSYNIPLALKEVGVKPNIQSVGLSGKSYILGVNDADARIAYESLYQRLVKN